MLSKNHPVSTILLLGGQYRADAEEAAAGFGERIYRIAHFHLLESTLQRGFQDAAVSAEGSAGRAGGHGCPGGVDQVARASY